MPDTPTCPNCGRPHATSVPTREGECLVLLVASFGAMAAPEDRLSAKVDCERAGRLRAEALAGRLRRAVLVDSALGGPSPQWITAQEELRAAVATIPVEWEPRP